MEILIRRSVEHLALARPFPSVLSFRFRHFEQPRACPNPFSPAIPSTIATVMCGRFAFFAKGRFGYESLQLPEPPPVERYNIAPSQDILAIRSSPETGRPEWAMLRWGLVPSWSKESKTKHLLINARAEGVETKPSFRGPVRHRRCIVTASGFYEWLRHESRMCDCLAEHPNLDHPFPCLAGAHQVGIFLTWRSAPELLQSAN